MTARRWSRFGGVGTRAALLRQQLWEHLDSDKTGYVSLREISEAQVQPKGLAAQHLRETEFSQFRTYKKVFAPGNRWVLAF